MQNKRALALPDALLVRYYREGRIAHITRVTNGDDGTVTVQLREDGRTPHTERWRDLGGGLGYVPDGD